MPQSGASLRSSCTIIDQKVLVLPSDNTLNDVKCVVFAILPRLVNGRFEGSRRKSSRNAGLPQISIAFEICKRSNAKVCARTSHQKRVALRPSENEVRCE